MNTLRLCRAAVVEDRRARANHVGGFRIVADRLQREIGLDARAHVEAAAVYERPASMIALDAAKINGDAALESDVSLLAAEMAQKHIFRRNRRVGLEFETPMAVLALPRVQRLCGARDGVLRRVEENLFLRKSDAESHAAEAPAKIFGFAPMATTREAASQPDRTAPSIVAGRPVWTQSPARKTLLHCVREGGRMASCAGVAAKVARFSLTIRHARKGRAASGQLGHFAPDALGERFARPVDEVAGGADRDRKAIAISEQPLRQAADRRQGSADGSAAAKRGNGR